MKGTKLIATFENFFPQNLAYDWDNVGLQIGTLKKDVSNVLLSLDLTIEVINEAIEESCNLIIVHHPVIFGSIKNILTDNYQGMMIEKAIKNDIAIYVAHTNFDISNVGMNKILADMLGLKNQEIIEYTTDNEGLGRIGTLPEIQTVRELINNVKTLFNIDNAKYIGDLGKNIRTVAISGGSGSSLLRNSNIKKADIFISGDISYHHALDAINDGITVLDIGHNVEKYSLESLRVLLQTEVEKVHFHVSKINTNPYKIV